MPLVLDDSQEIPLGDRATLPEPAPEPPAPSALDVAAAAERQFNVVGMAYNRFYEDPKPDAPAVPGFDPIASVPQGYEQYADRFLGAQSPQEVQWIKGRINDELSDRQTIARAGGWGVAATLAAGATDPLTIASMAIPVGGATRLAQAVRLAAVNAGTSALQEGAMQAMSETRTPEESLTNIGTGAILGGVLGAAIRPRVPLEEFERMRTNPDAALGTAPPVNQTGTSTAGAAAVSPGTLEGNTISGAAAQTLAGGLIGEASPGLRLLTSPSLESRNLVQELSETPELLQKNFEGIATPTAVETILRGYEGDWYQGLMARDQAYRAYRERIAGEMGVTRDIMAEPMGRPDFDEAISQAMRRGDQSIIPEVAQAASDTRRIVFDPLKERAQKLGLLPQDLQTVGADSYLMRQYDPQAIKANYDDWMNTLTDGFMRENGMERAEARDLAYQTTRNVLGSERGTMDWHSLDPDDTAPKSGRLIERKIQIPDVNLEPFLNNNINHLTHSYLRTLAPEVEMTERFGSRDLKDQFDAVRDSYSQLMEQASAKGDSKRMAELDARRDADIRDLAGLRDRLYGIYGQPKNPGDAFVRMGRFARQWNALRLLGAATLAHFPDIGNVILKYGLPNTLAAMGKLGTKWEAIQLARAEGHRMGIGLDMVQNTTAALLGDYAGHSQYAEQRWSSKAARAFTIATGETPLITMIQSLASVVGQDELLRAAEKVAGGEALPTQRVASFASAGLDQAMLKRIATQATKHGREVNGLKFGMSDLWEDQRAAQAFESAIRRDAHGMTLTPGAGDTPLAMSNELWKTILQFKSFAFAAARHVLMPLAQGLPAGDVRAMQGLLGLIAGGYAAYWCKQKAAGQPVETDPKRVAMEVLDKSNLLSWTGELLYPALWQAGFKDFSRWSDRDATETILGPTAGTAASVYERRLPARLMGRTEDGEQTFNRADLHFLRRLMPAQNLWYMRRAVNGLEDSVGDLFDLQGTSQQERAEQLAAAGPG